MKSSKSPTLRQMKNLARNKRHDNIDSLSALPDELIHHIFSFLDIKLFLQISILSKRLRNLWMSSPTLNFHMKPWPVPLAIRKHLQFSDFMRSFINLVDRVLHLTKTCKTHKFSLITENYVQETAIHVWVAIALQRHVQVLHLQCNLVEGFDLPDHLFTSDIQEIKLHSPLLYFSLPSSMCTAASVTSLELVRVRLPDANTNGELVLCCPNLESLIIKWCRIKHLKVLTISAVLLKSFEFEVRERHYLKLIVCTPSLTSIKFIDFLEADYCFENLSSLVSADVYLSARGLQLEAKEASIQSLIKVLRALHNVKALAINANIFQILAFCPDLLELLPNLLKHSRCTDMAYRENYYICGKAKIFQNFPFLEALVLGCNQVFKVISAFWEKDSPFQCPFSCLRTIEIQNARDCAVLLKFFEFVLKGATVLKEIILTITLPGISRDEVMAFGEKLLTLPCASSNVSVSFPRIT